MDSSFNSNSIRRSRRRPPLKSYVPFAVFVMFCLIALALIVLIISRLTGSSGGNSGVAPLVPTSTSIPATALPSSTLLPGAPTLTPGPSATPIPTVEPPSSQSPLAITPGGPLPTTTPKPPATPTGNAHLVIARDIVSGKPVESAVRFVSPAVRLYAIATVHHVHLTDHLRFIFLRDGKVLPNDDISYTAGLDASVHSFTAYADYSGGAKPLPHGAYRVLFYRNGRLEAATAFIVG